MLPMSVAFSGGRHRPFQCSRRHPEGVEMSRRRHVTLVPSLQSSIQPPALESWPGTLELFPVIRVMVVCLLQIFRASDFPRSSRGIADLKRNP